MVRITSTSWGGRRAAAAVAAAVLLAVLAPQGARGADEGRRLVAPVADPDRPAFDAALDAPEDEPTSVEVPLPDPIARHDEHRAAAQSSGATVVRSSGLTDADVVYRGSHGLAGGGSGDGLAATGAQIVPALFLVLVLGAVGIALVRTRGPRD